MAYVTKGKLYQGLKTGLKSQGYKYGPIRKTSDKLGVKKQGGLVGTGGERIRTGAKGAEGSEHLLGKSKREVNRFLKNRLGSSASARGKRAAIMGEMFSKKSAASNTAAGTAEEAQATPRKRTGLFSRGDSASRARAQIASQFGTRSGGPGFTSDRSSSTSSSAGGSSKGSRPSGPLF
ncbi:MAG: hypothetical protein ABII72_05180 [Parcubacteria group bacterium]